jgi:hypothetical protein
MVADASRLNLIGEPTVPPMTPSLEENRAYK